MRRTRPGTRSCQYQSQRPRRCSVPLGGSSDMFVVWIVGLPLIWRVTIVVQRQVMLLIFLHFCVSANIEEEKAVLPLKAALLFLHFLSVGGLAEVTRDLFIQADVVDYDAYAGDADQLALQRVFHLCVGDIAVDMEDVILD
jgi:hypothetical protein